LDYSWNKVYWIIFAIPIGEPLGYFPGVSDDVLAK